MQAAVNVHDGVAGNCRIPAELIFFSTVVQDHAEEATLNLFIWLNYRAFNSACIDKRPSSLLSLNLYSPWVGLYGCSAPCSQ